MKSKKHNENVTTQKIYKYLTISNNWILTNTKKVIKQAWPCSEAASKKNLGAAAAAQSLTVGPDGDEGGSGEEEHVDHVAAEEEPAQRGQVVEPGGGVGVECLVEECLEVGLPAERPDGPQALEGDDEVGEDGTPRCRDRAPGPELFTTDF